MGLLQSINDFVNRSQSNLITWAISWTISTAAAENHDYIVSASERWQQNLSSFAQFHAAVNGNVLVCRKWLQDLLTSTHHPLLHVQNDKHHGSWVLKNTPHMLPMSETLSRAPRNRKLWMSREEGNHEPRTKLIHDQHNLLSLQTDEHTPVKHKRARRVPSTSTSRVTRTHRLRRRDRK